MALGIQDLMAAAQRAGVDPQQVMGAMGGGGGGGQPHGAPPMPGGGGGMPPQGMPPAGGGMPPPGGGGGMPPGGDPSGGLMQLISGVVASPQGQQMMQAIAGAMKSQPDVGPGSPMPGGPPGASIDRGAPTPQAMPPQGMSTEDELAMAQKMMGARGPQDEEPSPQDVKLIMSQPTDQNLAAFDAKYGKGAAAFYLSDGKTNDDGGDRPDYGGDGGTDDTYDRAPASGRDPTQRKIPTR